MESIKEQKNDLPYKYKAVAGILREGKDNAIVTRDIMKLTGIKNKRDVYEIIEQLINKHGYVIGANRKGQHKGYFLITNREELIETSRTYETHINSMMKRHRNLQKNYANKDQLELEV